MKVQPSISITTEALRKYLQNLQFDDEIITSALQCFSEKQYQKGEYFSHAGQADGKLGFITQGLFHMFIENEEGKLFTKDFLSEGQFLLAVFDPGQKSLANIRAIQDSTVLVANYSDIQKLYAKYPAFEHAAKLGAENRIQAIYARMESFPVMDAKERYNQFLAAFVEVEKDIPQHLVASYLGITPTQLSRIRKSMKP